MTTVAVVHHSRRGHTAALAEAIAQGAGSVEGVLIERAYRRAAGPTGGADHTPAQGRHTIPDETAARALRRASD